MFFYSKIFGAFIWELGLIQQNPRKKLFPQCLLNAIITIYIFRSSVLNILKLSNIMKRILRIS